MYKVPSQQRMGENVESRAKRAIFLHFRESFRRREPLLLGKDSVPKPIFAPHIVPEPDFQNAPQGDAAVAE